MACYKLTQHDAKWVQFGEEQIFLGDVKDESNSTSMGVGYARYDAGAFNAWTVTYDEVLIILSGSFSVEFDDQSVTAGPGEMIWLEKGTSLVYKANTEAVLVYVSYPVWGATDGSKANADLLRPVDAPNT